MVVGNRQRDIFQIVDPRSTDQDRIFHAIALQRTLQSAGYHLSITTRYMKNVLGIRRKLIQWYRGACRKLPWRETRDPYRIWVSEIMLQQTRVTTVLPYYGRFLERFPNVEALADAREEELLTVWSGLGYYSRPRNLQKAARQIVDQCGFPTDYEAIRRLPGVGDYTAAAVASIAFDLPYAVLDGNVIRVLSRILNEAGNSSSSLTKKRLAKVAGQLLDPRRPGLFNQALMELGAIVCLPKGPACLLCPVSQFCEARRLGKQNELPVKPRREKIVQIEKTLLLIERDASVLLWKRATGPRLHGFWELPESSQLPGAKLLKSLGQFRHSITNHNYLLTLVSARISRVPGGFSWISKDQRGRIPLSSATRKALSKIFPPQL
jgi:A/G-specific adenine glycosylase